MYKLSPLLKLMQFESYVSIYFSWNTNQTRAVVRLKKFLEINYSESQIKPLVGFF